MWLAAIVGCDGGPVALDEGAAHSAAGCAGEGVFTPGASATTPSGVVVSLVSTDPAVPDVGDNTWVLALERDGAAVDGVSPRVEPWMPLHGHGLVPPEYVGTPTDPGVYAVPTFDLIMPGLWEIRVDLAAAGEEPDEVVFTLCAEG